jgi:hypothetical protein
VLQIAISHIWPRNLFAILKSLWLSMEKNNHNNLKNILLGLWVPTKYGYICHSWTSR